MKTLSHRHLTGLLVVIGLLGVVALVFEYAKESVPGIPDTLPSEEPKTPEACENAGGTWNPCASACPDAGPDEVCIQVCVERCEF